MKKTAVGNMTNSKQMQQRIEGDFDALFRSNKAARNFATDFSII